MWQNKDENEEDKEQERAIPIKKNEIKQIKWGRGEFRDDIVPGKAGKATRKKWRDCHNVENLQMGNLMWFEWNTKWSLLRTIDGK